MILFAVPYLRTFRSAFLVPYNIRFILVGGGGKSGRCWLVRACSSDLMLVVSGE